MKPILSIFGRDSTPSASEAPFGRVAIRGMKLAVVCAVLLQATAQPLRSQFAFLTTITNPTPSFYADQFGWSVAALENDRVLIGAPYDDTAALDAGAAYLYSTNGTLLTTFINPAPSTNDAFGWSVAALGNNRVLIGAPTDDTGSGRAGAAYLFAADGTPLTMFTNPTPVVNDLFGWAVASVGNDLVLISAYMDDTGKTDTGIAYLFSTNGALLNTITNPTPAYRDEFGYSVAALGKDRLLIGARADTRGVAFAGAAYLYNTNGTLLTTFTNPAPVSYDYFGNSVAAIGDDRVLIGAFSKDTGATDSGVVYLFRTNGTLLNTITNPTPAYMDSFGYSLAAVGNDRVLIGAYRDDTGAADAGIAYLFDTSGTLLDTITNPAPDASDNFGASVAASGNLLVIGAYADSTGFYQSGAVHVYALETARAPSLGIFHTTTNTVAVAWPSPSAGWELEQNTNSLSSLDWSSVTGGIQDDGTTKTLIVNPSAAARFYRLHKP